MRGVITFTILIFLCPVLLFSVAGCKKTPPPPVMHTVSLSQTPSGAGSLEGAGSYAFGSSASVFAIPNRGYLFSGWYEGDVHLSSNAYYSFTITRDFSFTAHFDVDPDPQYFELTLISDPPEGGILGGEGVYEPHEEVTVSARSSPGFSFVGWFRDERFVSSSRTFSFTITRDITMTARFIGAPPPEVYTLTIIPEPEEGGNPTGGGNYVENTEVNISAGTNENYVFQGWFEDELVSESEDYSFTITRDMTLRAEYLYVPPTATVSITVDPPEGGTVSGDGVFEEGESINIEATPNEGFFFVEWIENDSLLTFDPSYSFLLETDRSFTARFAPHTEDVPRQVLLTWQGNTSTTMTLTWRTDEPHSELAKIRYTDDPDIPIEEYSVEKAVPFTFDETSAWINSVNLTGLSPATEYHVMIGHPQNNDSFKFRTAPSEREEIVFLAGGDSRPPGEEERRIINEMAAAEEPDFVIFTGDFINSALSESEWDEWFDDWHNQLITPGGRRIPIIPAIGNHEVSGGYGGTKEDAPFYYNRFMLPDPAKYYSLTYGADLLIVTLDSDHTTPVEEQNDWLEQRLSQSDKIWKFVQYHVAAWPSVRDFDGTVPTKIRNNWVPLFEQYGVNVAIEAHDHAYKLTESIKDGEVNPDGVIYAGDGGWGAPLRTVRDPDEHWWLKEALSIYHFWKFTLMSDGHHLLVEPVFHGDPGETGEPFMLADRNTPDPNCDRGIESGNTCCAISCESCGGADCNQRPGGAESCCSTDIADSGRLCSEVGPPCIM